ncbi:MAG: hypothetical protein MJ207_03750 [Bacilli bacterium]|nr:hypothetical protein [Bacilli bacterium]
MKKPFIYLIPITFLMIGCGGGNKPQKSDLPIKCSNYTVDTETSKAELFFTTSYEYFDNGLIKKQTEDYFDLGKNIYEYTYNAHNDVMQEKYTSIDEEGDETIYITTYSYQYDDEDRIKSCKTTYYDESKIREDYTYESNYKDWDTYKQYSGVTDNEEKLEESFKHKFDKSGLVISEINAQTNSHDDYKWDKYGCNTLIEMYDFQDVKYETEEYEYYKHNPSKIAKCVTTIYNDGEPSHTTEKYTYDSYDRLTKMESYDNDDKLFEYDVYEYAD